MFLIIADEDFEDCWGGVTHKGDVLETNMEENTDEFLRYLKTQYQDIKVKWRKVQ